MEEMSVRRVDAKGRVYLSRKLRGQNSTWLKSMM
jgi:hypothetical protein